MRKSKRGKKEKLLAYRLDDSHPHWIDDADEFICSVCGNPVSYPRSKCPCCESNMTTGRSRHEAKSNN